MKQRRPHIYRFGIPALLVSSFLSVDVASAAVKCADIFSSQVQSSPSAPQIISRTTNEAWTESTTALKQINQAIYGRGPVVEALTTAILAKEFVWMNGEPGGAKTFLSRLMFQSVLSAIPEKDKKVFVLQFHKLISMASG